MAGANGAEAAPAIPPEGQPQIQRAISVGRILHAYDRVAAEGTDVMLANADAEDKASIGGYVVEHDEARWTVAFFTQDAAPRIVARITIVPGKPPAFQRIRPAEPASAAERAAIGVSQAAIAAVAEVIQPLNPVVLPCRHVASERCRARPALPRHRACRRHDREDRTDEQGSHRDPWATPEHVRHDHGGLSGAR